jgi:hypothetical protein
VEKYLSIQFKKLIACAALVGVLWLPCCAQTTPTNADSTRTTPSQNPTNDKPSASQQEPANKDADQNTKEDSQNGKSGTSNDRLFFTLPNFLTLENAGQVPPLTTGQKFRVVARGSFDPIELAWYGLLSSISQAEDSEPGFGQGWEGYGKRYGASFADGTIENFMVGAVFPSMLHQDPRYFQMSHGSILHRTLYAASRNLITRSDSGQNEFNYSEVLGGASAAAISTYSYHPKGQKITTSTGLHYIPSDRTLTNTGKVWGTQYGYDTLTLVIKEFWPDVRRAIKHKRKDGTNGVGTPGE